MSKDSADSQTLNFLVEDIEKMVPGRVPEEYLKELYFFMRPPSENIQKAVFKHLCNGVLQSTAADEYGVKQGNISRQVKRLEEINNKIFGLKKYIT